MSFEGFRFQSHLNKEGYLETSLLDINPPELNEPILQPGVRSMNMKNPGIDRTRDESNLRISDDLNELDETIPPMVWILVNLWEWISLVGECYLQNFILG